MIHLISMSWTTRCNLPKELKFHQSLPDELPREVPLHHGRGSGSMSHLRADSYRLRLAPIEFSIAPSLNAWRLPRFGVPTDSSPRKKSDPRKATRELERMVEHVTRVAVMVITGVGAGWNVGRVISPQ